MLPATASRAGRAVAGTDTVPLWSADLPRGGRPRRRPAPVGEPDAVYLPACVNAMFGPAGDGPGVQDSSKSFARWPESPSWSQVTSTRCAVAPRGRRRAWRPATTRCGSRTATAVVAATRGGELPLVCDASSCTEGLVKMLRESAPQVRVIDAVTLIAERVLPGLADHPRLDSLTVHPTCSSTQLGMNDALLAIAREIAHDVAVPLDWGCCAFAGDRGMLHPELTASATADQAAQVRERDARGHASCNRTCELAMTRATGKPYRHVIEILADLVAAAPGAPARPMRPGRT